MEHREGQDHKPDGVEGWGGHPGGGARDMTRLEVVEICPRTSPILALGILKMLPGLTVLAFCTSIVCTVQGGWVGRSNFRDRCLIEFPKDSLQVSP